MGKHKVLGLVNPALGVSEMRCDDAIQKCISTAFTRKQILAATNREVDTSWLLAASSKYHLSSDIRDYVVAGVPVITSDFPNRNLQAMPKSEILSFNPRFGRPTYRTFVGKPTFQNHQNDDVTMAKGVNLDSIILSVPAYGIYKIIVLSAFDRTKDRDLANGILKKERKFYSMGAWVDQFKCSICGANAASVNCEHMKFGKGKVMKGKLVYQICQGIDYFENSSVDDPADLTAVGDDVYSF
jgi:hypothetical protein